MKYDLEDLHNYAKGWYDSEGWSDLNMALDSGYTDLALKILFDAGAINSLLCYPEAKPFEKAIEKRIKKYTVKMYNKDYEDCFGNAEVYVNPNTNEHAFIRNKDVDYLLSDKEMRSFGYVTSEEYYSSNGEPKETDFSLDARFRK